MKKKWLIQLLVLSTIMLAASFSALAVVEQPYHLKLLAVQESGELYIGSDADLFLELKEGSGRVFLDTYPLTKLDTQISTRFAKEIACNHFKLDCERYDFIYTIKSRSSIIGGPSAGAAVSALTTIAVMDLEYTEEIAITGTINSGGIIGPVGGVKEKLEAASKAGVKKVLIAKGNSKVKLEENESELNLIAYGNENLSLEVVEVMDIDEIVYQLTGKKINQQNNTIVINPEYNEIMKGLQQALCQRTKQIKEEITQAKIQLNESIINISLEKENLSNEAVKRKDYYSAASFCFSNNIILKEQYFSNKLPSIKEIDLQFSLLNQKLQTLNTKLDQEKIETIANLQTLMIVKERLNDVDEQIKEYAEDSQDNNTEGRYYTLAYAEERFFSALSWMQFFSMNGKKIEIDQEKLKSSCLNKISEAEERNQYVNLFLSPVITEQIKEKITLSRDSYENENYELCLIKASQAKAESNAILSSLGVDNETATEFINSKNIAVERVISNNNAEDVFPILGYSYYQYSNSLKEQPYTALIYLEYALDMSDLSIYFPAEEKSIINKITNRLQFNKDFVLLFEGFLAGILVAITGFMLKKMFFKKPQKIQIIRKSKED
ncbi:hypothetical protein COY27_06740 [Candidatus Woesearchaeota archaeon CG_4_10_14_0_2_um_filter_33_13]|nr:MAG: hypothetical protein COY27_06740 [Candidatus Woesearchaeota archaeon CG_4_10_14_0_2_um_filter_33_13]